MRAGRANRLDVSRLAIVLLRERGNEPIHVHCQKGEKEAKFWLDRANFEATAAFTHRMSPADIRTVKKLIYAHFDDLGEAWDEFDRRRRQG